MYRAVTWLAVERSLDLEGGAALGRPRRTTPSISTRTASVGISGHDVTDAIRQAEIDRLVPIVARHPEVRTVMRTAASASLPSWGTRSSRAATSEPWSRPTRT